MDHKRCNGWANCSALSDQHIWRVCATANDIILTVISLPHSAGHSHQTESGSTTMLGWHIDICMANCHHYQHNRPVLCHRLAHRSSTATATPTPSTTYTVHIATARNTGRGTPKKISILVSSTNSTWWYYFTGNVTSAHSLFPYEFAAMYFERNLFIPISELCFCIAKTRPARP